jgi:hypothetical protein
LGYFFAYTLSFPLDAPFAQLLFLVDVSLSVTSASP